MRELTAHVAAPPPHVNPLHPSGLKARRVETWRERAFIPGEAWSRGQWSSVNPDERGPDEHGTVAFEGIVGGCELK